MTIRLYNTMTKSKEEFVPLDPNNVRMYVCGPTVYDFAHIGNARPAIVFDVLFRLLRHAYGDGHVTYVRNITDIDDKINARAAERAVGRNLPILDVLREITEATYGVYREDVTALGCLPPTHMPRATEFVAPMIAMTRMLIDLGYAYAAEGHVLFRVKKKADYGKLARRSLDDMLAGARVDVAPYKEDPMDFVLWKPSTPDQPGWDSPWGYGRPGWHLECSAMIEAIFKGSDTIDIHGGGIDLLFPHHENEIAQSESAHHGHPLARVWMHNGFLNVEGEKMSKSLGNFVTVRQLLGNWMGYGWSGDALRFCMLRTHYRQPMDWTRKSLEEAHLTLCSLYEELDGLLPGIVPHDFLDAIEDDLNTPKAIAVLETLRKQRRFQELLASLQLLGLSGDPKKVVRKIFVDIVESIELTDSVGVAITTKEAMAPELRSKIDQMIEQRTAARARKDFKESDRIRDELLMQGIVLKDGPSGTTWEVKR